VRAAPTRAIRALEREALDRCQQRDPKGYCRIYAVGTKVRWPKAPLPLPADLRADPLDVPLTPDDAALIGRAVPGLRLERF
jgi:hypothetical protein